MATDITKRDSFDLDIGADMDDLMMFMMVIVLALVVQSLSSQGGGLI